MTRAQTLEQIEKELATAKQAQARGNEGMVRVCARRAAGVAITLWLRTNQRNGWGVDVMNQLRSLALDASMPQEVINAALGLTAKVNTQFMVPSTPNPLNNANIIIHHLLEQT
jgi:hypothetical protein